MSQPSIGCSTTDGGEYEWTTDDAVAFDLEGVILPGSLPQTS